MQEKLTVEQKRSQSRRQYLINNCNRLREGNARWWRKWYEKHPIEKEFWKNVKIGDVSDCWPWTKYCNRDGYGQCRKYSTSRLANRVAWELINGPIKKGMLICHICDNPPCCNPYHMFIGTHAANKKDASIKGRLRHNRCQGINNPKAKLTEEQVRQIRSQFSTGNFTLKELSYQYPVNCKSIHMIVHGITWSHII